MAARSNRIFTGLAGLPAFKEPHKEVLKNYGRLLRNLDKLPAESKYKVATEQLVKERKAIVEGTTNHEEFEKKIGAGLSEELVEQAKLEMKLVEVMNKYKPWEPLEEKPPQNQWKWPI